jgi:hypothetical protein
MYAYNKVTLTFISEMLLMAILIISLIISIKKRKKIRVLRFFPFYLGYFLFVFICGDISYFIAFKYNQKPIALTITSYTDYSSTLMEMMIFLHFFYSIIQNRIVKRSVPLIALCFSVFFFGALILDKFFPQGITERTQSRVYTIEAAILMSYSAYCLIEIIRNKIYQIKTLGPNFWISVGYFLFASGTLPYSIIEPLLRKKFPFLSTELYSLFYLFYIILFCFIIKAYMGKIENEQPFNCN